MRQALRAAAVPVVVTIDASADAYIDSGNPTTNYGGAADLSVSLYGSPVNVQQTLAGFSLTGIPAGAAVEEARFELYLKSASGLTAVNLGLGRNAVNWKESTVVFASHPPCLPLGVSAAVSSAPGWYGWDVTALVGQWLEGSAPNNGICITGPGSGSLYTRRFISREAGTAPGWW